MRFVGRIVEWNDAKGFGFVEPNGGGERTFVHVKAFERQGRRPVTGDLVSYEVQRDARGRGNAAIIRFAGVPAKREPAGPGLPRQAIALLCMAVLGLAWWLAKLPTEIAGLYAAMSVLALLLYGRDKAAARNGAWRTPESTLHAVAFLGGWPGALLAQGLFRHKSRKADFQFVFWSTVVLNCGALAWLLPSTAVQ